MPPALKSITAYRIEFLVRASKVVFATDDENSPKKFISSPSLSETQLCDLCQEVVSKANSAVQKVQPTFQLMIDEFNKILPAPSFVASTLSGGAPKALRSTARSPNNAKATKKKSAAQRVRTKTKGKST